MEPNEGNQGNQDNSSNVNMNVLTELVHKLDPMIEYMMERDGSIEFIYLCRKCGVDDSLIKQIIEKKEFRIENLIKKICLLCDNCNVYISSEYKLSFLGNYCIVDCRFLLHRKSDSCFKRLLDFFYNNNIYGKVRCVFDNIKESEEYHRATYELRKYNLEPYFSIDTIRDILLGKYSNKKLGVIESLLPEIDVIDGPGRKQILQHWTEDTIDLQSFIFPYIMMEQNINYIESNFDKIKYHMCAADTIPFAQMERVVHQLLGRQKYNEAETLLEIYKYISQYYSQYNRPGQSNIKALQDMVRHNRKLYVLSSILALDHCGRKLANGTLYPPIIRLVLDHLITK